MQIVKVGVEAALSVATGIFVSGGDILFGMGLGAISYVLLTYYAWYMRRCGGSFSVFLGKGGFTATLLSFGFMIISPLIPLILLVFLINSLGGLPESVESVLSILLVIAVAGFVVLDIGRAINPEFLKRGNGNDPVEEQ